MANVGRSQFRLRPRVSIDMEAADLGTGHKQLSRIRVSVSRSAGVQGGSSC